MASMELASPQAGRTRPRNTRWLIFLATIGPGLTVMLADTDAGSVITAAQSGAQWGYKLLWIQLLLIPFLYFIFELTVRIGITTGKGHGELIREYFGAKWAWISVTTLFVSAMGALVTEFAGIAGAGLVFGISPWVTVPLAALGLILITLSRRYRRVELIAIFVGLFELAFIPAMLAAHPDPSAILHSLLFRNLPLGDKAYWYLIAANVGAVIMPWMVFYQQGAVIDKGLSEQVLNYSRIDTAVGSVLTQIIMAVVLVLTGATIGLLHPNASLVSVQQIADALTPFIGSYGGKALFALGISGAALIAAFVVSTAVSWAFGEVMRFSRSLNCTWKEAPAFYGIYGAGIVIAAAFVLIGLPLVSLTIAVEVMNALLLPIVVGFLIALGWKALPEKYRLHRWEKIVLLVIYVLVCSLGIFTLFQL
jgi:NRAMP (natural resistance-associated macrophage protein)-like metal ion transporter